MHLESLTDGDPNIKQLTLGAPEHRSHVRFEPERDIAPEEWETIIQFTNSRVERSDWTIFALMASRMHILNPTAFRTSGTIENRREIICNMITRHFQEQQCYLPFILSAHAFLSLAVKEYTKHLDGHASSLERRVKRAHAERDWAAFIKLGFRMSQLFPLAFEQLRDVYFNETVFDTLERWHAESLNQQLAIDEYGDVTTCLRLLFPEEHLHIPDKAWRMFRSAMQKNKEHQNWNGFTCHAFYAHLLAAPRLEMTDRGLRLSRQTGRTEPAIDPLPAVRKFYGAL